MNGPMSGTKTSTVGRCPFLAERGKGLDRKRNFVSVSCPECRVRTVWIRADKSRCPGCGAVVCLKGVQESDKPVHRTMRIGFGRRMDVTCP